MVGAAAPEVVVAVGPAEEVLAAEAPGAAVWVVALIARVDGACLDEVKVASNATF